MKYSICIPTLDKVDASFFSSFIAGMASLPYNNGENVFSFSVKSNSLVYDARNEFALEAIRGGYDYTIFIDSDMVLPQDAIARLIEDARANPQADIITGLYFKRRIPTAPVLLKELDWYTHEKLGPQDVAEVYTDYPSDSLFKIAGCGMGCCIIRTMVFAEISQSFRVSPFTPLPRLSEDYAFCWRAAKIGNMLMCDSSIKPAHAGIKMYTESDWRLQRVAETIGGLGQEVTQNV